MINKNSRIQSYMLLLILVMGSSQFLLSASVQARTQDPYELIASEPAAPEKISPQVKRVLTAAEPGEFLSVIVKLGEQANISSIAEIPQRAGRINALITAMQNKANATQDHIKTLLERYKSEGSVAFVEYFWVFNGLALTATADVIQELAKLPAVSTITPNSTFFAPANHENLAPPETNQDLINAPGLWHLGYKGQGIVVANMDTGVYLNHVDLYSKWRGGTNSWFDPYGEHPSYPFDANGHGTWTMGAILGGDAGGTSIGTAPEAQWIAVKIFNDQGIATAAGIHAGFQWLLDPDGDPGTPDTPHVVNNSWTFQSPGCDLEFQLDLLALRAAGILPVFAAGNSGPLGSTSYSPSNNPAAFAVGGVNDSDLIYINSSRGPSSCGEGTTIYPELVAPAVEIHTTDLFGLYYDPTGTSMAAPHVAGGLALLLNAFPDLTVETQENALKSSSIDLGTSGPDNDFGYGRLDLLAAYNWLDSNENPTPTPTIVPTLTPTPAPASMHIGDLDGSASKRGKANWKATITIVVHDNDHNPVSNAMVSGVWTGGFSGAGACTTNRKGKCDLSSGNINNNYATVIFTVESVSHQMYLYQSSSNHDPDGDSNGTSITVYKP